MTERLVKMDKAEELLYKSFELSPLPKMSVEIGRKPTTRVLDTLEYLGHLTTKRDLTWLGMDKKIQAMDKDTMLYIRDHHVYSKIRRTIDHGVAKQYGEVLLSGGHAPESLIAVASAIALAQKKETGEIDITRKKELGLTNKHARELVKDFHDINSLGIKDKEPPEEYDGQIPMIEKEDLPELKTETTPKTKYKRKGVDLNGLPWRR